MPFSGGHFPDQGCTMNPAVHSIYSIWFLSWLKSLHNLVLLDSSKLIFVWYYILLIEFQLQSDWLLLLLLLLYYHSLFPKCLLRPHGYSWKQKRCKSVVMMQRVQRKRQVLIEIKKYEKHKLVYSCFSLCSKYVRMHVHTHIHTLLFLYPVFTVCCIC